jgi:tRNA splicing endonuclease
LGKTKVKKERKQSKNAMREEEIRNYIKEALGLQDKIENLAVKLDEIKEILKLEAKAQERLDFKFDDCKAVISHHTPPAKVDSYEFYKFLRDQGRGKDIFKFVKAEVKKIKDAFGKETILEIGAQPEKKLYHKIRIGRV